MSDAGFACDDANDILRKHGVDALRTQFDKAIKYQPRNGNVSDLPTVRHRGLVSARAADITPESVQWLWPGRLARGKHTCVAGEPGTGKSQLSIAIIAAITTGGDWPCGEGQAPLGSVIILSAEDGAADTIVPRLIAAGADLARVHIVSSVYATDGEGRRAFSLQTDIELLE